MLVTDEHLFIDPVTVLHGDPALAAEADADCDVGAAIAILIGRFPVTYTKAFALLLAYSERTQRSMPNLAAAVLKTYSPAPDAGMPSSRTVALPGGALGGSIAGTRRWNALG